MRRIGHSLFLLSLRYLPFIYRYWAKRQCQKGNHLEVSIEGENDLFCLRCDEDL